MSEPTTPNERALASLRHLYAQMSGGVVRDTFSAVRIATGLLGPAIEALERAAHPQASTAAVPEGAEAVAWANPVILLPADEDDETVEWTARVQGHKDSTFSMPLFAKPPRESGDAERYRAFFDSGLPVCFMGQEFHSKEECDKAIDAAIRSAAEENRQ